MNSSINKPNNRIDLSGFDLFKHFPPKYNIFGYPKTQRQLSTRENILKEVNSNETHWVTGKENENEKMTRTKLIERRQLERKPDLSYDLDKDGYVGGRDLVIAKRYDLDGDGKLNEKEKAAALEGLANNIDSTYQWNLDSQGHKRPFRIIQKRGEIINAEDFQSLQETYPKHPLSKNIPHIASYSDLQTLRRGELKRDILKQVKEYDKNYPSMILLKPKDYSKSTPKKHNTSKEIKAKTHRNLRKACGLNEFEDVIGTRQHSPSLAYVRSPKHKSIKDIQEERHLENKNQAHKIGDPSFKDEMTRFNEREEQIFSKLYSTEDRMTKTKLDERRKKEMSDTIKILSTNRPNGIHGHELPQFSRSLSTKEYWKNAIDYNPSPKISSQVELKESMKYWKPREELLINDHSKEILTNDLPFKVRFAKTNKNSEDKLILNVNKINIFKDFDPNNPRPIDFDNKRNQHITRWSSLAYQFVPKKNTTGRLFDSLIDTNSNKTKPESNEKNSPINKQLSMFQKANEDHQVVIDINTTQGENKTMKENILQRYAMSSKASEIKNLIRNAPIKTKGF